MSDLESLPECESCVPREVDEWLEDARIAQKEQSLIHEWSTRIPNTFREWHASSHFPTVLDAIVKSSESVAVRFYRLAADWSENTHGLSSVDDLISDPSYQQIIQLGWPVVPLLLMDLQKNKRFWFPALYTITKIRPFDPSDVGNFRRMTEAWIKWGKRKQLI